jgi:hypothetical protein
MKTTIKAKIIAVGNKTSSITVNRTTDKVVMQVVELPDNPFGHTPKEVNPFDVEVYNHNIENFNVGPSIVGEIGLLEMSLTATGPAQFRCIALGLTFGL